MQPETTDASSPLYHVIANDLRMKILTGCWDAGQKIPPELTLCEVYRVSRTTIRKALNQLTHEGLIERKRPSGTYVCDISSPRTERATAAQSFTGEIRELGEKVVTFLATARIETADKLVATALGLPTGSPSLVIRRIRGTEKKPFTYAISHLVPHEWLPVSDEAYYGSLYEMIEAVGVSPRLLQECVEAVQAPPEVQKMLTVNRSEPMLKRTRLVEDPATRYRELSINYYRGSMYRYYLNFAEQPIV